jgi:hypothetical protein
METIEELAERLVHRLGRDGYRLDYTPESLGALADLAGSEGDDEVHAGIAAYYGEVMRRSIGQEWLPTGGAFPVLHVGHGIELDPLETAARLLAGDAGALVREYAEVAEQVQRGVPEVIDDASYHVGNMGPVSRTPRRT